jgi:hypothetical protein
MVGRRRSARRLGVVAMLGAALAGSCARASVADTQKLYVTFELTQTFRVTLPDGTRVGTSTPPGTTIAPGTYELIFDNSTNVKNLNFQLTGPNVSLQEDMGGGEESSAGDYVTFLPSSQYSYHDANNQASAGFFLQTAASGGSIGGTGSGVPGSNTTSSGSSTSNSSPVGSKGTAASSAPSTSRARLALRGTLIGTVSAAGTVSLSLNGKSVTTLKAGRYTFKVTDRSAKSGFIVQEIRKSATTVTGVRFVGKRTLTLPLGAGQWFCYPSFVGKKTYFAVTT